MVKKYNLLTIIISLIITAFFVYIFCTITISGYKLKDPDISPSGNYDMQVLLGRDEFSDYMKPYIVSRIGKEGTSYIVDMKFYTNFNTIIKWGKNDTLWVYSSDIGIYCWELVNKTWIEVPKENLDYDIAPAEIEDIRLSNKK